MCVSDLKILFVNETRPNRDFMFVRYAVATETESARNANNPVGRRSDSCAIQEEPNSKNCRTVPSARVFLLFSSTTMVAICLSHERFYIQSKNNMCAYMYV